MKNHQARAPGSTSLPEVHATSNVRGRGREHDNNCGNERGHGRGRGRNIIWHRDGYNHKPYDFKKKKMKKAKTCNIKAPTNSENACNICGKTNHWAKQYRTSKHFVGLYQASLKKKGKDIKINCIDNFNDDEPISNVRFESSDSFDNVEDVVASFSNDGYNN